MDTLNVQYAMSRKKKRHVFQCTVSSSLEPHFPTNEEDVLAPTIQEFPSIFARVEFWDRYFPEFSRVNDFSVEVLPVDTVISAFAAWCNTGRRINFDEDSLTVITYLKVIMDGGKHAQIMNAAWTNPESRASHELAPVKLKNDLELMRHQAFAYYAQKGQDGFLLAMKQGTGKTAVVIAEACALAAERAKTPNAPMVRVLIVAPKNVRQNWLNEFERFANVPYQAALLRGGRIDRLTILYTGLVPQAPDVKLTVFVIAYESWVRSEDDLAAIKWDIAALDEAHYLKYWKSKRTLCAFRFRDSVNKRFALTGTPFCNSVNDYYSLLEWLREGGSGFSSIDQWRNYYNTFVSVNQEGQKRIFSIENLPVLKERLSRMSFVCTKEDALPFLPPKMYDTIEVSMTDEQWRVYKSLRDQLYAEITDALNNSSRVMQAQNILTKLLRLAQITSGFSVLDAVYDEEGTEIAERQINRFDPNPKIEELMALFKDPNTGEPLKSPDSKTIIWACWVPDLRTLRARFDLEGIPSVLYAGFTSDNDRALAEAEFNGNPECKVFIGNQSAGGTGLNLLGYPPGQGDKYTTNCDHVIYFSQGWSPAHRGQSEDRACRNGQRVPVRITDLTAVGTIDVEIRARVTNKIKVGEETANLRDLLERLMKGNEPCE